MKGQKRGGFSNSIGFVLAAAGSAVGVGNIWRFPYLAAKDGGGLFLIIYVILVLTFGFTLLSTDIAIGRKTKKNAIKAFASMHPKWGFLGKLTFLIPSIIMMYYSVVGGWVLKYTFAYVAGQSKMAATDGYFTNFITSKVSPIVFTLIFLAITSYIVYSGVEKGVERVSKMVMPFLMLMIIGIAIFSLTLKYTDVESGITRTGIDGLLVYLIPNFKGLTFYSFLNILVDAMSQLFFSLSVSMGIMITYGSYVKDDVDLNKAVNQIEIFDTGVALVAGMMIIPAVYVFSGPKGMSSGAGLMFVSLPKIFDSMGSIGIVVGIVFFIMVFLAALTSCISIMETIVSSCMEIFHTSRKKTAFVISFLSAITAIIVCMGYNYLYFEISLPNGQKAQILDLLDYISNSFLLPLISLLTCVFIGWIIKPKVVIDELEKCGQFHRKTIYIFIIKYVAPIMMGIIFLQSTGIFR